MTEVSLTAREIAQTLSVHKSSIMRRADKESWAYIEKEGRGGRIRKYPLAALPQDIQLIYNKDRFIAPADDFSATYNNNDTNSNSDPTQASSSPSPSRYGRGAASPGRAGETAAVVAVPGLADWQTRIALARYDLVSLYIKDKLRAKKRPGASVGAAVRAFCEAFNSGQPYPDLYAVIGQCAWQTIEKWAVLLARSGNDFTCLAPQYGQHLKGRRQVSDAELAAMLKYGLHPNQLRPSQIIRMAKRDMATAGTPCSASEATLRRLLEDWIAANYDQWVFARRGEKALDDECLPFITRDSAMLSVGDVLVADGHTLNFQVVNPLTGKPCRPTLLLFYDWASRMPAGWTIMTTENVQCIHSALRRAIIALGKIPKYVYLDNGRAFKARFFTDKSVDFEQMGFRGLYARLGIDTVFAAPYNAKAKIVERYFGTFNELERLLPSYTGRSIEDKPAHMQRNERIHRALHNPFIPTIAQTDAIISAWIREEYARRPHRGLDNARPIELWERGRGPGVDEHGLRYLMMTHELKRVHRNGVTLFGQDYYDEALYGYRGEVWCRYDILDMEQVYLYSQNDPTASDAYFLCAARPVRGIHPLVRMSDDPLDQEALKQQIKRRAALKRYTESEARAAAKAIAPANFTDALVEADLPMSRAQIEEIEAAAAEVEVIDIEEKKAAAFATWDGEAYEQLFRRRCAGESLTDIELADMAQFEAGDVYKMMKPFYQQIEQELAVEAPGLKIVNGR